MSVPPSRKSSNGACLRLPIPGFVSIKAQGTLANMEIKLHGNDGAQIVVWDVGGYASVFIDPDGAIDRVEWARH